MKSIILLLAMVGILMVGMGFIQNNMQCPPSRIEYRYVPKTFTEEQQVQTPLLAMTGVYDMFEKDSPWMSERSYATQDIKNSNPV
jgi:hypothetical protein